MAKKETLKSFDFLYIMGLKFSSEDLTSREWYHLANKGDEIIEINGKLWGVKRGKNHYNISHNYLKFWLLYHYWNRASYEYITMFYFWARKVEKDLKSAIIIKQICGLLPNEVDRLL